MRKETATRFSVSLPPALLKQFDAMGAEKGYDNRSLAIADLIRAQLVEHQQRSDTGEMAGTITLVLTTTSRISKPPSRTSSTTIMKPSSPPYTCIWTITIASRF